MTEKDKITTPLIELLEQIHFDSIDNKNHTATSDKADIETIKLKYQTFVTKALKQLKIAAGYTDETN